MIRFQQIRNATVKLCYPNATFLIDPWLSPTCTPEERDAALHEDKLNGNQNETTPDLDLIPDRRAEPCKSDSQSSLQGLYGQTVLLFGLSRKAARRNAFQHFAIIYSLSFLPRLSFLPVRSDDTGVFRNPRRHMAPESGFPRSFGNRVRR